MKPRNIFILLWICCMTISCATANPVKVNYDYDPEVDFTAFRSYDWFPVPAENAKYALVVTRLKKEINAQLKDLEIERVYSNPDFLIALHGGIQSWLDQREWQYLHANFKQYAQKRKHDFPTYFDDTIIVDFIDVKTKILIYRATATVYISIEATHEEREKKVKATVSEIIATYAQVLNNEL